MVLTLSSVRLRGQSYHSQVDSAGSIPVTCSTRQSVATGLNSTSSSGRSRPERRKFAQPRPASLADTGHRGGEDLLSPAAAQAPLAGLTNEEVPLPTPIPSRCPALARRKGALGVIGPVSPDISPDRVGRPRRDRLARICRCHGGALPHEPCKGDAATLDPLPASRSGHVLLGMADRRIGLLVPRGHDCQ